MRIGAGGVGGGSGGTGGAGAAGAARVRMGTGSFFTGAGNGLAAALSRSVADEFTTAGTLVRERASSMTAGDTAGLIEGTVAAGVLGFDSRSFLAAEILMSATLSFWTSAKP